MILPRIPITLVDAEAVQDPIAAALVGLPDIGVGSRQTGVPVLAGSDLSPLARRTVSWLDEQGVAAYIRLAPSRGGLLRRVRSESWSPVPIAHRAARFPVVSILSDLAPPTSIILTHDLNAGQPPPIEGLLRYVHRRLALTVRLTQPESGAAADVALAFRAVVLVLTAIVHGHRIIAATPDLVAGHLLALALQTLAAPSDEERAGPWEDPTVQRATELDVGVIHPDQLELLISGDPTGWLSDLRRQISLSLGIEAAGRDASACP